MKILFTSPIIEHPAAGGPQLRIENSIKALSKISELYIVVRNYKHNIGGGNAVKFYSKYTQNFSFSPSVSNLSQNKYLRKTKKIFRNLFSSELDRDAKYILQIAKENNINIIWFGYGNISYDLIKLVNKFNSKLQLVCDTDSVWSRFILRELPYVKDRVRVDQIKIDGELKEKEESEWVDLCDITTAVSEVDAQYYRSIAKDKSKVMLFSNVIDMNTYSQYYKKSSELISPNIYLAGSFVPQSAMDKAARWFINDIYPLVKKEIPEIHFYIVGSGSKETLHDIIDESISVMGKVESVLPYLSYSDVSIVPLRFESGTRFKIMEAAACNVPIVSTTLGAEGIPVKHEKDILIADTEKDFANSIIRIIINKEFGSHLSNNCYDLIKQNNSVDTLVVEAKKIIERLDND